jgi:hypothetical protein
MLDVASNRVRNIFVTHSQHACNIYLVVFRSNGWRLRILRSNGHGPVRRWRPDRTSGASSAQKIDMFRLVL